LGKNAVKFPAKCPANFVVGTTVANSVMTEWSVDGRPASVNSGRAGLDAVHAKF
jgi:hypothetical protein